MLTIDLNQHRHLNKYAWPCPKCNIWNDIVPRHANILDDPTGTKLHGTCNVCMEDYTVDLTSSHIRQYEAFQFIVTETP